MEKSGISVRVLKLNRIAPLSADEVSAMLKGTTRLLVLEDCLDAGCVGQRVAALALEAGVKLDKLILRNCGSTLPTEGSVEQLYSSRKLDGVGVAASIEEALHEQ